MAKKRRNAKFVSTGIQSTTVAASLIFAGIIVILFGIYIMRYEILPYIISTAGIFVFILGMSELGIKKYTSFSKLKTFETQQKLSFLSYALVLIFAISTFPQLTFILEVPILGATITFMNQFAGGTFIFSGLFLILEVRR